MGLERLTMTGRTSWLRPTTRLGIIFLSLASCADTTEIETGAELRSIRIALNWFPEAEHGGFYAALVHGYFEARGLDVQILAGGPDAPVIQRVATGQVEFGVTNADGVLNARAAGAPIVALMAPYQTNPRCILVHAHSGITSVAALSDVTLALSQRPAFAHFLRHTFTFEGVTIVPYHGGVARFVADSTYAQQGYVFSEPVIARREGADARALLVAETGFNPYASLLVADEGTLRDSPDLVRVLAESSVRGWQTYLERPDETNLYIHSVNPEMDMEILEAGARMSRPLVIDSVAAVEGIGHMSLERWKQLYDQMVAAGLIDSSSVNPGRAYTTSFLPASASEIP